MAGISQTYKYSSFIIIFMVRLRDKIILIQCYIIAGINYFFNSKKFVTVGQFLRKDILVKDENGIIFYARGMREDLGYIAGNTKPETSKWFMPKNGEIVIDAGVAIGKFSLLAAKNGAYVISIEPHPITFNALMKNIELNGFKNIRALNVAVGKDKGKVELYSL